MSCQLSPHLALCTLILASSYSLLNAFRLGSSGYPYGSRTLRMVDVTADVAVIGGGPAGTSIAWMLQVQQGCSVVLIDPAGESKKTWYPNYGEWRDEWHALADSMRLPELKDCTTTEWDYADCFFGGSRDVPMDQRTTLPRGYVRVDRVKMQELMRSQYEAAQGKVIPAKLQAKLVSPNIFDQNLIHDAAGSTLTLSNGMQVRSKVVIDATGFESRLVAKESPFFSRGHPKELPVGYQIAYGFIGHVDSLGPYDEKAMTLFDYRTGFCEDDAEMQKDAVKRPTFMYAMPLGPSPRGGYRVFFEETSLVGKGERMLSFSTCKDRALKRLAFHKIQLQGVEEEEYCYIPMGGQGVDRGQRVIAFGGAGGLVHPATGYQVNRMLAAGVQMSELIGKGLGKSKGAEEGDKSTPLSPDALSLLVYSSLYSSSNLLQRDFQLFGGDFLMSLPVDKLRGFFQAFFSLDQPVWSGFLAGWPGLPNNNYHDTRDKRLSFALSIFWFMPNDLRVEIIWKSIAFTLEYGPNVLLRSLLPLGQGPQIGGEGVAGVGKVGQGKREKGVKDEAREMMKAFSPSAQPPEKSEEEKGEKWGQVTFPAPFNNA